MSRGGLAHALQETRIAKSLGVKLGKVTYIVESLIPASSPEQTMLGNAEAYTATAVHLGQHDMTVSVTVRGALL